MDEISLLASIMDKTDHLIAGVADDQLDRPTPCPDYDVAALIDHIVGWAQAFEAGANCRVFDGDPSQYRAGEAGGDPAGDFRKAAGGIVAAWRDNGIDRKVQMASGGEMEGRMSFDMTLMEYTTHGWDLAVATDQPVPYTEAEAAAVLERAEVTLPAQYRGEGMPFGDIVEVPDHAPAVDRLVAFLGRPPEPTLG
jgi:uncharacterized protein (TIGR03086 family)